ncbi:MAG: hypothetical protein ACI9W2_005125, partial [Gammaproteobacteria bacterium]
TCVLRHRCSLRCYWSAHPRTSDTTTELRSSPLAYDAPYDEEGEIRAFEQFKLLAHPHLSPLPTNSWEWLAVAQHHGLPTRLLDWSENALVAAYFAVEQSGTSGDAAIYAIRRPDPVSDEPFQLKVGGYLVVPHLTPRIPAQSGVFTAHPDPPTPYKPARLRKWVIKSGACFRIREMLETCGVNRARLFPDVDGIAQYLEWRYKWGKW